MSSHTRSVMVIEASRDRVSMSPLAPVRAAWHHRRLIGRLAWREIAGRYRGSLLGISWAVILPILMLVVYTFVFSVVFAARWGTGPADGDVESKIDFALVLFAGLIPFNLFAECILSAPRLILNNPSYVKKVVFPVEVLPLSLLVTVLFNVLLSSVVLLIAYLVTVGIPPQSALLAPLLLVPLIFFSLGLAWILSSLGVFLRDMNQFIGVLVTMIMFLSPLFYPLSAVPESVQAIVAASPLTMTIEGLRGALFAGMAPPFLDLALLFVGSWLLLWLGYLWFMNTKRGFADVI